MRKMLQKSQLFVGVAPISHDHIIRVQDNLVKRGVINPKLPNKEKLQITTKSLVKSWSRKHLKMDEKEWKEINIDEISTTDNSYIIFIKCKTQEDAALITTRARHLPNDTGTETPRIVMHVDIRAKKRHQAILKIAKTIREHSNKTLQTSVRAGRQDYLLRKRGKGSNIPWNQIPPEIITQNLPQFDIGDFENIFDDKENEEEVDMEEIDEIEKDIRSNTKRNRSTDKSPKQRRNKQKLSRTHELSESSKESGTSDSSSESDDDHIDKLMNSTPNPASRNKKPSLRPNLNSIYEDSNEQDDKNTEGTNNDKTSDIQPEGIKSLKPINETPIILTVEENKIMEQERNSTDIADMTKDWNLEFSAFRNMSPIDPLALSIKNKSSSS